VLTNTHQHLQAEEHSREVSSAEYCLKARKRLYLCHDLKAVACNSYEETPPDPSSKRKKGNFALSYMIKPIPNISRYPLCGLNFFLLLHKPLRCLISSQISRLGMLPTKLARRTSFHIILSALRFLGMNRRRSGRGQGARITRLRVWILIRLILLRRLGAVGVESLDVFLEAFLQSCRGCKLVNVVTDEPGFAGENREGAAVADLQT
jgi:hypothetical protein